MNKTTLILIFILINITVCTFLTAQNNHKKIEQDSTEKYEFRKFHDPFILRITIDSLITTSKCHCYSKQNCSLFKITVDSVLYVGNRFFENNDSFFRQLNLLSVYEDEYDEIVLNKPLTIRASYYFDYRILSFSGTINLNNNIKFIRDYLCISTPGICGKHKLLDKSKRRKGVREETTFSKYIDEDFELPTELEKRITSLKKSMMN